MSRKNLSRTVIEGGRTHYNRWERRHSHVYERAATRAWIDQVLADGDVADEIAIPPRPSVGKSFNDKLGPAKRWLAAQVGRPWDKVYAELRARFDSRTIAGKHVVEDHMLGWVERGDIFSDLYRQRDFFVDAHGILRKATFYGASWGRLRKQAEDFAQGRRAAHTHRGWWWFRSHGLGGACFDPQCAARHEVLATRRYHTSRLVPERAMTPGELRGLDRLHPYFRARIVAPAP